MTTMTRPGKIPVRAGFEPWISALEANALTTRSTRRSGPVKEPEISPRLPRSSYTRNFRNGPLTACQTSGMVGSALGLVCLVSVGLYSDQVRQQS